MSPEIITTTLGKHWLDADEVVRVEYSEGTNITIVDAMESNAVITDLARGGKKPLLVDIRELKSITKEARAYLAGEESTKNVSRLALLVGSPISRMIGNFFLAVNRLPFAVSLFSEEQKALSWLRSVMEDENDQSGN